MLIVSIQNFKNKTQNIVDQLNSISNIFAIRTDQPIETRYKVIGLKKNNQKYYITTNIKHLKIVSQWSDYVALDCRKKNKNLSTLLDYCLDTKIKIVADISSKKDINNLIKYQKIIEYVATTFCYKKNITDKCDIIRYGSDKGFDMIAEGGFYRKTHIKKAKDSGASHICIGNAIFNYTFYAQKYAKYCSYE